MRKNTFSQIPGGGSRGGGGGGGGGGGTRLVINLYGQEGVGRRAADAAAEREAWFAQGVHVIARAGRGSAELWLLLPRRRHRVG